MKTMKKKVSYKNILYKSKRMLVLGFVVLFGTGLVVTSSLSNEIPIHDGDVLVDSLHVSEESEDVSDTGTELTLAEQRAALELERNKILSNLDKTIENSSNASEKTNAELEKERILSSMEKELSIEAIILSKGLPESFVLITEQSVNVTVNKQELDTNTVAKICDIIMRETGLGADKIIIQSMY